MSTDKLATEMTEALKTVPLLDAHTHLTGGKMNARGLHDILLYHMVVSDLYAAGCPNGARLTEYPGWPTIEEAHQRLREAIPYLRFIQNTSCFWGVRMILRDLYDWHETIDADNWQVLDDQIRERSEDRVWQEEILQRANLQKFTTEWQRRETGLDDDLLHYSMEWAFFTRTQRSEFDTALYELERCWGKPPGSPLAHGANQRPASDRLIHTLDDLHAAMQHYVCELAATPVISLATHISTDIVFCKVNDDDMSKALAVRDQAGPRERDIYASYIHEAFLTALAPHADRIALQFSFAAEPLPHETGSRVPQRAIADLSEFASRHPKVRFVCLLASQHADQSLCTLCRELPNIALAGYWWHNFFPGAIRQVMEERLDMLPTNKQIGFFSDAYSLEWSYAKSVLVRNQLAQVLAQKIQQGQYSRDEAMNIAHAILFNSAQETLGMRPRETFMYS